MACDTSQQDFLDSLQLDQENNRCVDCDAPDPEYASITHGSLLCENCFHQHSAMPNNLSRPVNLRSHIWSPQDKLYFKHGGNSKLRGFLSIYSIPAEFTLRQKYLTPAVRYYREHLMCLVEDRQNLLQKPDSDAGFILSRSDYIMLNPDTQIQLRQMLESVKNFFFRMYRSTVKFGNRIKQKLELDVGQNPKLKQLESDLKPRIDSVANAGMSALSRISTGICIACNYVYSLPNRMKGLDTIPSTESKVKDVHLTPCQERHQRKFHRQPKEERASWSEIDYPTSPIRLYDLEKYHEIPPKMPSELMEDTSPTKLETRSFNELLASGKGKVINIGKEMKGMAGRDIHSGSGQIRNTLQNIQKEKAYAGRKENIDPVIKKEKTVYESFKGKEKKIVTEKAYTRKSGKIDVYRDVKYQPITTAEHEYKGTHRQPLSTLEPPYREHVPTHKPEYREHVPTHKPEYREHVPSHKPEYREHVPTHKPEYREHVPSHKPEYREHVPSHEPAYREHVPSHKPAYREHVPSHEPAYREHVPSRTPERKQYREHERPEYISSESSSVSSPTYKHEESGVRYRSESPEEHPSKEIIRPKARKLSEIYSISPDRRIVEHEYPTEQLKKKQKIPLKEKMAKKIHKVKPEHYEYSVVEPTYTKPSKAHQLKEKIHKVVHPHERDYETYEYPGKHLEEAREVYYTKPEKYEQVRGRKYESPEKYEQVRGRKYESPEEHERKPKKYKKALTQGYEPPEEYETKGKKHKKVHGKEYESPEKYEKVKAKKYESPEEYETKGKKHKKVHGKEYESPEEYETKGKKHKKVYTQEYEPTHKKTPKIISHGEALPTAEYQKPKKHKLKKPVQVVHEPTYRDYIPAQIPISSQASTQPVIQAPSQEPTSKQIATQISPVKVQPVDTTQLSTYPSEEVIVTKPIESKPVVSKSAQPAMPKTHPDSETTRKYYRTVPGKDNIQEEIIERRIIYREPIPRPIK